MDAGMMEQVMWHIHNFFVRDIIKVERCAIEDGSLPASVSKQLQEGQWYLITGSTFNDGVHRHPAYDLTDETFTGSIGLMAVPKAFIAVVEEIQAWIDARATASQKALESPYASESFDGYSYSLRSDLLPQNGSQGLTGWQAEFASRLNTWRKMA